MMAKTHWVCQLCGYESPKWWGSCPQCRSPGGLVEEIIPPPRAARAWEGFSSGQAIPLSSLKGEERDTSPVGISELDRVLGGGIVKGGVTLVGGDPGIGKSTLLLQALGRLAEQGPDTLYVSGEESLTQIRMRADRMGISSSRLYVLAETSLEAVFAQVAKIKPRVMVIDSIQTIFTSSLESAPGSISQVRETAARIIQMAKASSTAAFLIGHVTKEGSIAGPRALEHLVDTVLYFEGEPGSPYRILRAVKNRFGSTDEIGVFEMQNTGLISVDNPSQLFLSERASHASGSGVIATMQGSRPILVEVQALVSSTPYGLPRRNSIGIDTNRVSMLMAVLEKRGGLNLSGSDLFVNVAGGMRVDEPAADLGVALAIASSFRDRSISPETIIFGEVGLTGEVRAVHQAEQRVREGERLGFCRCLLPWANAKEVEAEGIKLEGVRTISDALEAGITS